jgi:hypothetical protein
MKRLTIIKTAQLTDVGSGIIWVIRPLHILGIPKISVCVESMLLPTMRYSKVIRRARRHVGEGANLGRGIYSDWYLYNGGTSVSTLLSHLKFFMLT